MQLHQLQPKTIHKDAKRIGRGGKRGKTSGKGGKGQTARTGTSGRPEMRDIIKRMPKLRGRGKNIFQSFQTKFTPVNLDIIEKHFAVGETVSPETLVAKGIAELLKGQHPPVKILAMGEITKKLSFTGCAFSMTAKAKIEKAGGSVK